jgi:hypothetical protein
MIQGPLLVQGGGRRLGGIVGFDDEIGDIARGLFVATQAHHMRGIMGGGTVKHEPRVSRQAQSGNAAESLEARRQGCAAI